MKVSSFDWDAGNLEKLKKHNVPIDIVESFFFNENVYILSDEQHSFLESRFIAFGQIRDRDLIVVFTFRANCGDLKIRVISARYAHKKKLGDCMKKSKLKKKVPVTKKVQEIELGGDDPVDQDFSNVNLKGKWVKFSDLFEYQPKNKTITLRVPESMLDNLKKIADKEKTDYQKLVREALADLITRRLKKVA